MRGVCNDALGNKNMALEDYNIGLRINPKNGYIYMCRASLYIALGEKENAIQDYKKAADFGIVDGSKYLKELYSIDYPISSTK